MAKEKFIQIHVNRTNTTNKYKPTCENSSKESSKLSVNIVNFDIQNGHFNI